MLAPFGSVGQLPYRFCSSRRHIKSALDFFHSPQLSPLTRKRPMPNVQVGCLCLSLTLACRGSDCHPRLSSIVAALEKDGCVTLTERQVKICKDDYFSGGKMVEAVSIRPTAEAKYPGLLLIPGHEGRATAFITLGIIFAGQGFACFSVGQPCSGKTQVELDFVGPKTIKAMIAGYEKFKRQPYVDFEEDGNLWLLARRNGCGANGDETQRSQSSCAGSCCLRL